MNTSAPLKHPAGAHDLADESRIAALTVFKLEALQHLAKTDLCLAQSIAGHGDEFGIWKTPAGICPGKLHPTYRAIDIAKRLRDYLAKESATLSSLDELVNEALLEITRLALLMRLAPTVGLRISKVQRLTPSSVASRLYQYVPQILARAIRRKSTQPNAHGLLACLTQEDLAQLRQDKKSRIELDRLGTLAYQGWWSDLPPAPDITLTTDPRGTKQKPTPQVDSGQYEPIPDDYLADIGPRVLWLIRDLGPNLLPLLEDLACCLEGLKWSEMTKSRLIDKYGIVNKFIEGHLRKHPWKDHLGKPLQPDFRLATGVKATDRFEWPPRTYEHFKVLSVTLQSAQLFITLLACAARIGEVETLPRNCVHAARNGNDYVHGWTYKLAGNLFGDARQWPAPAVLVQALGQQSRLAAVWSRLPTGKIEGGLPKEEPAHRALWLSLGTAATSNAANPLGHSSGALQTLAERVGMDPKPGGINLHPHRFRKTIGRIAGVALFNSPLVLKRLFGHKSIEMTLRYILSHEDVRTEAEAVLRELRIIHCAEALEEIRDALARGVLLPEHSGEPAARLAEAVKEHESRLQQSGRVWANGSAFELAYLLTANGQGWRFIQKNIVCTKVPGEDGLCRKKRKRGEPDTSNCKPECANRIVLALKRRDSEEILESYLDVAREARGDEQYLVFYQAMRQFLEELAEYPDIEEQYLAKPEVKSLVAEYEELRNE